MHIRPLNYFARSHRERVESKIPSIYLNVFFFSIFFFFLFACCHLLSSLKFIVRSEIKVKRELSTPMWIFRAYECDFSFFQSFESLHIWSTIENSKIKTIHGWKNEMRIIPVKLHRCCVHKKKCSIKYRILETMQHIWLRCD